MTTAADLLNRKCRHQDTALPDAEIDEYLGALDNWALQDGKIVKTFAFKNYYRTMAFVNAAAYVFHTEDHHPEMTIDYKHCIVRFNTHSVNGGRGGLSENDFICAAKVDALYLQAAH